MKFELEHNTVVILCILIFALTVVLSVRSCEEIVNDRIRAKTSKTVVVPVTP